MKHILKFPEKFLWGASTASFQVEGGIENCDWAEAAREGRVPVCGAACDHYNRYESDFDIAQKLGHNCHKISIEWARIEPEEGKFDMEAVTHYKNVLNALRARGLEPFVNIWHFTLPLWFSHDGGFLNKKSAARFGRYSEFVAKEILNDVKYVVPINEPEVFANNGYMQGNWPPFKKNPLSYLIALRNLIKAHKASYYAVKKYHPDALVGPSKDNIYFTATGINPLNPLMAGFMSWWWNRYFLNQTKKETDFIGLNYYFYSPFGPKEELPKTDMGWGIYPEGIYHVLLELGRYHKPVYIMENGLADATDSKRKDFILDHLFEVYRAIQDNVDVKGYFHWSLLDNYEWVFGFERRFGLVEIDFVTQERKIRPSAFVYKHVCETNTIEKEL